MTIKIFTSSEVYRDADQAYEPVRKWLQTVLDRGARRIDTGGVDALICFIPAIYPDGWHLKPRLRFSSRDNSIDFRPNFNYLEFLASDELKRREIAAESLGELKKRTKRLGLPPDALDQFHALLDSVKEIARANSEPRSE